MQNLSTQLTKLYPKAAQQVLEEAAEAKRLLTHNPRHIGCNRPVLQCNCFGQIAVAVDAKVEAIVESRKKCRVIKGGK